MALDAGLHAVISLRSIRCILSLCLLCHGTASCKAQAPFLLSTEKVMHVKIQRTGGFAGITTTKSLDAANLSAPEIDRLERMIESAHFFELPALIPSTPQPDRFEYRITVERNGKKHSVTAAEPALPAELKPLVDWLMGAGKPAK
jgi:hypothetical protein